MIQELKKQLLNNPESIRALLEEFDFEHINIRNNNIRFARNSNGGQNINIRLDDEYLNVMDYVRGERADIISYIIKEKNTNFKSVLNSIKRVLNLSDDWQPAERRELFGGVYSKIINKKNIDQKTYDESILDQYLKIGNNLWLKDGISLETQRLYDVCFDAENNGIVFPWRNDKGQIIAIKSRYNGEVAEGVNKYYYPIGGNISSSLFNYSQCYQHLYGNDVVVVESEKACMQAYTFGHKNLVGIGSNNISESQAKAILQLQPKRIIIAFDEGLEFKQILKNIKFLKSLIPMRDVNIWYWDSSLDLDIPSKASPTDMGKEKYEEILNEQLIEYKEVE